LFSYFVDVLLRGKEDEFSFFRNTKATLLAECAAVCDESAFSFPTVISTGAACGAKQSKLRSGETSLNGLEWQSPFKAVERGLSATAFASATASGRDEFHVQVKGCAIIFVRLFFGCLGLQDSFPLPV
jgi:hypothetical protein